MFLNWLIDWILKDPARGHKAETHLKNKLKTPQVVPASTDIIGKSKNKKEAKRENRKRGTQLIRVRVANKTTKKWTKKRAQFSEWSKTTREQQNTRKKQATKKHNRKRQKYAGRSQEVYGEMTFIYGIITNLEKRESFDSLNEELSILLERKAGMPLCLCFIDCQQADDSIDRSLL